jgi:hypothetical protein
MQQQLLPPAYQRPPLLLLRLLQQGPVGEAAQQGMARAEKAGKAAEAGNTRRQ